MPVPRALPVAATCLGLVPALAGCVVHVDSGGFTARQERRFTIEGQPTVDLDTFDGAIEVHAWEKSEVLVRVESRASSRPLLESIEIEMDQEGGAIQVRASVPQSEGWQLHTGIARSAKLVASVPVDSHVRLRSGDGSVRVERVRGRIDARTDDGRIVMREVAGEIVAYSGDGSVQMEDMDGQCTVSTRDGSVLVTGRLRGALKATSGDGSVTIKAADGSEVSEDWQIETSDGGIVLALPDVIDARLDARTSDGRIAVNGFPGAGVEREGAGRSLQIVLGAGTRQVRLRTGDGSITLKRAYALGPPPPPSPPAPPAPPTATEP